MDSNEHIDQELAKYIPKKRGRNGKTNDPAPDATTLSREQLLTIVNSVSLTGLSELTNMRNECDELMRTLIECQDHLLRDVEDFIGKVQATIDHKNIMVQAMTVLREQYRKLPESALPAMPEAQQLPATEVSDG